MPTGPGPSTLWQAGTITGMVGLCWFHCRPKHKPDRLTVSRLPECYPGTRHHQFNMGQKQSRLHRGTIKSSGADATVILPPWETSSVGSVLSCKEEECSGGDVDVTPTRHSSSVSRRRSCKGYFHRHWLTEVSRRKIANFCQPTTEVSYLLSAREANKNSS
jgi:hypothetical protein